MHGDLLYVKYRTLYVCKVKDIICILGIIITHTLRTCPNFHSWKATVELLECQVVKMPGKNKGKIN